MNRYFFLLTGLLICCYVPINDVTARTMRGGGGGGGVSQF